jgi:DNA-directed RNA polymerase subunit omega
MEFQKILEATEKLGGPFAMTALLQKRVRELVQGSKPYVQTDKTRPIDIALEEVLHERIGLDYIGEQEIPQAPVDIFGSEV